MRLGVWLGGGDGGKWRTSWGIGCKGALGVCGVCVRVLYHYHVYRVGERGSGIRRQVRFWCLIMHPITTERYVTTNYKLQMALCQLQYGGHSGLGAVHNGLGQIKEQVVRSICRTISGGGSRCQWSMWSGSLGAGGYGSWYIPDSVLKAVFTQYSVYTLRTILKDPPVQTSILFGVPVVIQNTTGSTQTGGNGRRHTIATDYTYPQCLKVTTGMNICRLNG